jgi:hypothetical protein
MSPFDRYSTRETLQHPWVAGGGAAKDEPAFPAAVEAPLDTVLEMMRRFNAQERWRRAAQVSLALAKFRRAGAARARARMSGRGTGRLGSLRDERASLSSRCGVLTGDADRRGATVGFGGGGVATSAGMHSEGLLSSSWAEPSLGRAGRSSRKESQPLRASDERSPGHGGAGGHHPSLGEIGRAHSSVQIGTRHSSGTSPSPETASGPSRDGWRAGADTGGGRAQGVGWDVAECEGVQSSRQLGSHSTGSPQSSRDTGRVHRVSTSPNLSRRHSGLTIVDAASPGLSGGEGEAHRQVNSPGSVQSPAQGDGAGGPPRQMRSPSAELLAAGVDRMRLTRVRRSGSGLLGPGSAALARAESSSRSREATRPRDNNAAPREPAGGLTSETGARRPVPQALTKPPAFPDEQMARSRSRRSLVP